MTGSFSSVAVVLPLDVRDYHEGEFLRSVRSLQHQSRPVDEIRIVIHGGEAPESAKRRVGAWRRQGLPMACDIFSSEANLPEVMKATFDRVESAWVSTLRSGDQYLEPRLQRQTELLGSDSEIDAVVSGVQRYRKGDPSEDWLNSVSWAHPHPRARQSVSRIDTASLLEDLHQGMSPACTLLMKTHWLRSHGPWPDLASWEAAHWILVLRLLLDERRVFACGYPDQLVEAADFPDSTHTGDYLLQALNTLAEPGFHKNEQIFAVKEVRDWLIGVLKQAMAKKESRQTGKQLLQQLSGLPALRKDLRFQTLKWFGA